MRGSKVLRGREAGAAAVEFAILLPVLVLLLFGTIWFGVIFARIQGMEAAAREGARMASIGRTVTFTDVQAAARGAAPIFIDSGDIIVTVNGGTPGTGWCTDAQVPVTVRVTVPPGAYAVNIPLFGPIELPYAASGTFRCERPHD
jgi:Flp pilus assembly protein TadG